jgi:hypothetical protein
VVITSTHTPLSRRVSSCRYVTQSWLPQYFNQVLHVELQDVGLYAVLPCLIRQAVAHPTAAQIRLQLTAFNAH